MHTCFDNISYFESLDSSNDYLIDLYKNSSVPKPLTVYVDHQIKGRGNMSKTWFSGKFGLTFSFSINILNQHHPFDYNMITTIAIIKLLSNLDIQAYIKYPNDIVVNGKKIAGVLTEIINVETKKYAIIGVGLNVNNKLFPNSIQHATSIYQLLMQNSNKHDIFKSLIFNIKNLMISYCNKKFDITKLFLSHLKATHNYVNAFLKGKKGSFKILHLTRHGILTIEESSSKCKYTVSSNDISFVLS